MEMDLTKEIESITKQIVEKYRPEKIVLCGSTARGDLTADSDVDFLAPRYFMWVSQTGVFQLSGR